MADPTPKPYELPDASKLDSSQPDYLAKLDEGVREINRILGKRRDYHREAFHSNDRTFKDRLIAIDGIVDVELESDTLDGDGLFSGSVSIGTRGEGAISKIERRRQVEEYAREAAKIKYDANRELLDIVEARDAFYEKLVANTQIDRIGDKELDSCNVVAYISVGKQVYAIGYCRNNPISVQIALIKNFKGTDLSYDSFDQLAKMIRGEEEEYIDNKSMGTEKDQFIRYVLKNPTNVDVSRDDTFWKGIVAFIENSSNENYKNIDFDSIADDKNTVEVASILEKAGEEVMVKEGIELRER